MAIDTFKGAIELGFFAVWAYISYRVRGQWQNLHMRMGDATTFTGRRCATAMLEYKAWAAPLLCKRPSPSQEESL
ncbi:hypothetical protein Pa4123_08660 [Phytohabitans aurantiacus]|uniref:Uncharacterized protein n=1 Tax=Phytohabitans aurantiacus TaxID=3016789 RepID=A0ABQ5QPC7_9ACTN|nr:hypothetical protein Pa4123_08660 [Phytohabitans aurantiacus]